MLVASMVIALSLLVVPAASAAPQVAPGTPIASLPFVAEAGMEAGTGPGGRGSAAANAAVTQQCNGGVDLYNPQWFTLPAANLGKIYAHGTAWGFTVGGTQDYRFGVAVVDTATGAVLTCSDNPVSATTARPLSVVIYFAQSYADCATDLEDPCPGSLHLLVNTTAGVAPGNDKIATATTISTLPFTETVDTAFADNDGPELIDYDHCLLSSISRDQAHTVWWKFTPTTTISQPVVSVTAAQTPVPTDFRPQASIMVSTPTGPALPPKADPWNCDPPTVLTAGTTYYFAVFTAWDSYWERPLTLGGPVKFSVKGTAAAKTAPGTPTGVTATKDDGAATATISWSAPASNGGSPITGYRVSRNGNDTGNTGPFSIVLPASARSKTFQFLLPWEAYTLKVQAINAIGTGPAATATATLTAPTPSAPQSVAVTAGVGSAKVTWSAPAHSGSSGITGYRVRRFLGTSSTAPTITTLPASARSLTANGLTAGTGYTFVVQAINAAGPGRYSTRSAVVRPLAVPAAPTSAMASASPAASTAPPR
jgi:hypothetical protein